MIWTEGEGREMTAAVRSIEGIQEQDDFEEFSIFSKQAPLFYIENNNHESSTGSGGSRNMDELKLSDTVAVDE